MQQRRAKRNQANGVDHDIAAAAVYGAAGVVERAAIGPEVAALGIDWGADDRIAMHGRAVGVQCVA